MDLKKKCMCVCDDGRCLSFVMEVVRLVAVVGWRRLRGNDSSCSFSHFGITQTVVTHKEKKAQLGAMLQRVCFFSP